MTRKFMLGIFDSEEGFLKAGRAFKESAMKIYDAYTPYPMHELDKIMSLRRSWLPVVCFIAAFSGCMLSLLFQIWTSETSWAINVGGKPFNSLPAFIPITFEITVLIGGLVTTLAFLIRSKLFPGKFPKERILNHRVSDDRFVWVLEKSGSFDEHRAEEVMNQAGAVLIEHEEIA